MAANPLVAQNRTYPGYEKRINEAAYSARALGGWSQGRLVTASVSLLHESALDALQKHLKLRKKLVPQTGLEPVTPSLRMTCSTN